MLFGTGNTKLAIIAGFELAFNSSELLNFNQAMLLYL
jgi:hypothetical protein